MSLRHAISQRILRPDHAGDEHHAMTLLSSHQASGIEDVCELRIPSFRKQIDTLIAPSSRQMARGGSMFDRETLAAHDDLDGWQCQGEAPLL
jgi:hypothetical protein